MFISMGAWELIPAPYLFPEKAEDAVWLARSCTGVYAAVSLSCSNSHFNMYKRIFELFMSGPAILGWKVFCNFVGQLQKTSLRRTFAHGQRLFRRCWGRTWAIHSWIPTWTTILMLLRPSCLQGLSVLIRPHLLFCK